MGDASSAALRSGFHYRLGQLLDKERNAVGLSHDTFEQLRRQHRSDRHLRCERCCIGTIEPAQRNQGDPGMPGPRQRELRPKRHHHQHPQLVPGDVLERPRCRACLGRSNAGPRTASARDVPGSTIRPDASALRTFAPCVAADLGSASTTRRSAAVATLREAQRLPRVDRWGQGADRACPRDRQACRSERSRPRSQADGSQAGAGCPGDAASRSSAVGCRVRPAILPRGPPTSATCRYPARRRS